MRNEFREKCHIKRKIAPIVKKVLVSMGGGDPNNLTLKVLKGLKDITGLQIIAVIGAGYLYANELKGFLENNRMQVDLIHNSQQMSELMLWADLAVSAGGSTCWELACMGVPTLAITWAENQARVVEKPVKHGILIHLGWGKNITENDISKGVLKLCNDYEKRKQMSKKGRQLVDDLGVKRVISEIYGLLEAGSKSRNRQYK